MRSNLSRRNFLILCGSFLLALAAVAFFGMRFVNHTIYWASHRDEPVQEWMWIGYVAHSHRVDPNTLLAALGLPPDARDRRPLGEIARQQNRRFEDVRRLLEMTIAEEKRKVAEVPAPGREP